MRKKQTEVLFEQTYPRASVKVPDRRDGSVGAEDYNKIHDGIPMAWSRKCLLKAGKQPPYRMITVISFLPRPKSSLYIVTPRYTARLHMIVSYTSGEIL